MYKIYPSSKFTKIIKNKIYPSSKFCTLLIYKTLMQIHALCNVEIPTTSWLNCVSRRVIWSWTCMTPRNPMIPCTFPRDCPTIVRKMLPPLVFGLLVSLNYPSHSWDLSTPSLPTSSLCPAQLIPPFHPFSPPSLGHQTINPSHQKKI